MSRVPFTSPIEKVESDQRLRGRYPIALELQYKLLNKGRVERLGVGQTLNISSGGVLFEAAGLLPSSGPVELAISWPFLLDGAFKLKLVMSGRIVRSDAKAIAVKVEHHEFRTTGRSLSEKPYYRTAKPYYRTAR
jgi:hypothetical protein